MEKPAGRGIRRGCVTLGLIILTLGSSMLLNRADYFHWPLLLIAGRAFIVARAREK